MLTHYLELNLLFAAGFSIWVVLHFLALRRVDLLKPSQLLSLTHLILGATLALPLLLLLFPKRGFISPKIQIWSAPSIHLKAFANPHALESVSFSSGMSTNLGVLQTSLVILMITGALITLLRSWQGTRNLSRIIRTSHLIKKIGNVRILASDEITVPFSFWMPGRAYVVLSNECISDSSQYRMAVLHELQHHRQGDTQWLHLLQLMKFVFFWNPLVHVWEKHITTLQEFACDEALVALKDVSPHAYSGCLIQAAEQCLKSHCMLVGTTGMAVGTSGKTLKRRIDMMFDYQNGKVRKKSVSLIAGTLALGILTSVAFASQGVISDRRITLADAQQMAKTASQGTAFPIVINEAVLEQLNRFVGTPDGRTFIRDSIARMQSFRPLIDAKIQSYDLPEELLAVALIESGFQNGKMTNSSGAAGLWQFIAQTARHYGLRVDKQVDDRFNVELETDAAMRYLGSNHLRFQDWQLAILAYNAGESAVQNGIDETGSRDAWTLIDSGFDNDQGYLPKVMAAVLILKNPDVLK